MDYGRKHFHFQTSASTPTSQYSDTLSARIFRILLYSILETGSVTFDRRGSDTMIYLSENLAPSTEFIFGFLYHFRVLILESFVVLVSF